LVFLLPCITCGIYGLIWYVSTKEEMKARGAEIPTAWLLIVPFANIYWFWQYAMGVQKVTGGTTSAGADFCLRLFLGPIGMAITQSALNKVA
jgi:hypothetical protein